MTVEEIVQRLVGEPKTLDAARPLLPDEPGFYAWWTKPGSIPHVPPCPHPRIPDLHLFYVGISPSGPTSRQTIRKRVIGNHMRGNTGSSTFRLTLASLLFEAKGWSPIRKTDALLVREENAALSTWQQQHLRIAWAPYPRPWEIEHEVIRQLQPPLNLAGNKTHPFAGELSAARRRFKDAAIANSARS